MMLTSLFTLMYHALLRIGEVTPSKKNNHILKAKQIIVSGSNNKLLLSFRTFKFSKPGITQLNILSSKDTTCPVTAYRRYSRVRSSTSKYAFCRHDGSLLSPSYVTTQLRKVLASVGRASQDFNNHSMRIGKATDMARQGFTDTQICMAGRWSSSAFKKYIKPLLLQLNT